jgi:midasin
VVACPGKKDVADQIEDEEQVLGLKGEKEEDPERGAEEEKDGGMEMQVPARSRQQPFW